MGVDLKALSANDRFYIRAETLHLHAEAHADDIDANARLAFLSGGVQDGRIDLVVDVRIDLDDGSVNDGRLTLGEIAATPLATLATIVATGTLDGELPLVINGLPGLAGGSIGTILLGATDLFDPATYFLDTSGITVADALNFSNIDAAAIVTLIGQLADQLQDLKQSGAFADIEIPFVDGAVGAVLDFAELVSDGLLYDDGADNAKDGADRLLTDLNAALASAGLGDVLVAQGDGTHIDFEISTAR